LLRFPLNSAADLAMPPANSETSAKIQPFQWQRFENMFQLHCCFSAQQGIPASYTKSDGRLCRSTSDLDYDDRRRQKPSRRQT
jgi:hypothetical protein